MEKKSNKDVFMTVFFMSLVTIALSGLAIKTSQHEMDYSDLQWLAGVGIVFMIVFVLTLIDDLVGFTSYLKSLFGLNKDESNSECKCKDKMKDLENSKIEQSHMIKALKSSNEKCKLRIEELTDICNTHQNDKNKLHDELDSNKVVFKDLNNQIKELEAKQNDLDNAVETKPDEQQRQF